jgi:hypothetical protein
MTLTRLLACCQPVGLQFNALIVVAYVEPMAFQNFTFPQVIQDLGLTLADANLFAQVPLAAVRPEFLAQVLEGANLASAINTEKARSEFVIAPVLFELRRLHAGQLGLFSGIELEADASRGLNGVCDFVITKSPRQHLVSAPLITIIEAKNDNLRTGMGQCIAAMCAARVLNQAAAAPIATVYGAVTTGTAWKFLRLREAEVTLDLVEYHIESLGKILGIFGHIVETA